MRNAPHQKPVRRLLFRDHRQRRLVEFLHQLRHFSRLGRVFVHGLRFRDRRALMVRVRIRQRPLQPLATKHHHEPVPLPGLDDHFRRADFFHLLRQHRAQFLAHLRLNPSRATVRHNPLRVQRAEVRARRHVTRPQLQTQAQGFNHAAAHLELERIVTEQSQMSRPAARRDARRQRQHPALCAFFGQLVQVRRHRRLQRGHEVLLPRGDVSQAVQHQQDHLRLRFQRQFRIQRVKVHGKNSFVKNLLRTFAAGNGPAARSFCGEPDATVNRFINGAQLLISTRSFLLEQREARGRRTDNRAPLHRHVIHQPSQVRILPDGKLWARRAPRVHRFLIRAFPASRPLHQIEHQIFNRVAHQIGFRSSQSRRRREGVPGAVLVPLVFRPGGNFQTRLPTSQFGHHRQRHVHPRADAR